MTFFYVAVIICLLIAIALTACLWFDTWLKYMCYKHESSRWGEIEATEKDPGGVISESEN